MIELSDLDKQRQSKDKDSGRSPFTEPKRGNMLTDVGQLNTMSDFLKPESDQGKSPMMQQQMRPIPLLPLGKMDKQDLDKSPDGKSQSSMRSSQRPNKMSKLSGRLKNIRDSSRGRSSERIAKENEKRAKQQDA